MKFMPYIEKSFRTVVIATVATVFFISGLALCCQIGLLPKLAHKSKILSCCASSKTPHVKEQHPDSCLCCQISKNNPDRTVELFSLAKVSGKDFVPAVADAHSFESNMRASYALAYQGPPRAPAVPIYLQLSVLRL